MLLLLIKGYLSGYMNHLRVKNKYADRSVKNKRYFVHFCALSTTTTITESGSLYCLEVMHHLTPCVFTVVQSNSLGSCWHLHA